MQIEILREFHDMERLAPEWQELHKSANYRTLRNDPAFCLNWIKHFGCDGRTLLIAVRNQGRLDAVLPLRVVSSRIGCIAKNLRPGRLRKLPIRQLEGLMNSHTADTNILVRAGCEAFAAKAMKRMASSQVWQGVNLGVFPSDSPMTQVLRALPCSIVTERNKEARRFLRCASSYQDYLASQPALHKKLRKAHRRLERDFGPITLDWLTGEEAVETGFQTFVEVDSQSWKAFTEGGEALANAPLARGFFLELTERFAKAGRAHVWVLRFNGVSAACQLSFESDGVLYMYKTSYKEMFATCGEHQPGFVLQAQINEHAWPRFAGMDFMNDWFQKQWVCETYPLESEKRLSLDPRRWLRAVIKNSSATE